MELIQIRVDEETKKKAIALFDALGLDLSTAVRAFLKKAIAVGGMPFDLRIDLLTDRAKAAVNKMQQTSQENGNSEMTLEEINEEIAATRRERKEKEPR